MVRTVGRYAPAGMGTSPVETIVRFDLRIMTRKGETVVDFGEFKDLLSYNDNLGVDAPAGSWNLKMRARLDNENLLKKIHPGMVIEIYAARNQDPLTNVEAFEPQTDNPVVFQLGQDNSTSLSPAYAPNESGYTSPPAPDWEDYLDKAPCLLLRGITSAYGRTSAVMGGAGGETSLTLSGESYGAIYRNAQVLTDLSAPTALGRSLEVRFQTVDVNTVVPIYYGILRHWVEQFWKGDDGRGETGWEARTRPIPIPPDVFARITTEGSAWSALEALSISGLFQIFVDHTGAIVWEKLPYSSKDKTVVDTEYLKWRPDEPLRNWEDLPFVQCPSLFIIAWSDRLSCDRLANYVRCHLQGQMGAGAGDTNMDAGQCYNLGSILQYGGPRKLEMAIPARLSKTDSLQADSERDQRVSRFMDLVALEVIRWYDRPIQRVSLNVRGEPGWRINTVVEITENWHNPEAVPGQYLILSRSHSIDLSSGTWSTQLDCIRDRRSPYLGAGLTQERTRVGNPDAPADPEAAGPVSSDDELKDFIAPIEPDYYYYYNRSSDKGIEAIGDATAYNEFIKQYQGSGS